MASLLSLPREVREHIIEFAILHRDLRPQSLNDMHTRAELEDGFGYFSKSKHHGIRWPRSQATSNLQISPVGLLLSCRLLHEETTYVMSRQQSKIPELDILVVNEDELWPTWVYLPATFAERPRAINVTVRMLGVSQEQHSGFEEEAGLVTLWRFSSILERVLRCAWTSPRSADADEHIYLDALDLNFLTPRTPDAPIFPATVAPHWAQHERQFAPRAHIHPYALAMSLANWVSVMLQYRAANEPFMHNPHDLLNLVNRVTTMRFKVDGVLRHTEVIHTTPGPST